MNAKAAGRRAAAPNEPFPKAAAAALDGLYAERRLRELTLISEDLEQRLGGFGETLSADQERAALYLSRLAAQVSPDNGEEGKRVVDLASRAVSWRNEVVRRDALTDDMREAFAARGALAKLESDFASNGR